jgi:hypothetical protein
MRMRPPCMLLLQCKTRGVDPGRAADRRWRVRSGRSQALRKRGMASRRNAWLLHLALSLSRVIDLTKCGAAKSRSPRIKEMQNKFDFIMK